MNATLEGTQPGQRAVFMARHHGVALGAARTALIAPILAGCTLIHHEDIIGSPTGAERLAPISGEGLTYRVESELLGDSVTVSARSAAEQCTSCMQLEMERIQVSTYEKGAETALVHGLCWGMAGLTALPVFFIRDGEDAKAIAPVLILSLGAAVLPTAELIAMKRQDQWPIEPSWEPGPCEPAACPERPMARASMLVSPHGTAPPPNAGVPPDCERWPSRCLETDHTGSATIELGGLGLDEPSLLAGELDAWLRVGRTWQGVGRIDITGSTTYQDALQATRALIAATPTAECGEIMERYRGVPAFEADIASRCDGTDGALLFMAQRTTEEIESTRSWLTITTSYAGFLELGDDSALPQATVTYAQAVTDLSMLGHKLRAALPEETLTAFQRAWMSVNEVTMHNEAARLAGGLTRRLPAPEDLAALDALGPEVQQALDTVAPSLRRKAWDGFRSLDPEHRLRVITMLPEMPGGTVLAARVAAQKQAGDAGGTPWETR